MIDDGGSQRQRPDTDDSHAWPFGPVAPLDRRADAGHGRNPMQLDLWSALRPERSGAEATRAAVGAGQQRRAMPGAGGSARHMRGVAAVTVDSIRVPAPAAPTDWDQEVGPSEGDTFASAGTSIVGRSLRPAVVAGALALALALGWAGGWRSYQFFAGVPPAAPAQRAAGVDCLLNARVSDGCTSPKSDRDVVSSGSNVRKVASPPTTGTIRVPETPRAAASQAGPSAGKDASARAQHALASRGEPRPVAVPETRPTTIEGWTVREVNGATVVLQGPDGTWRAARGDTVPGVGRVDSIVRWGNRWIVATTRGLISTD